MKEKIFGAIKMLLALWLVQFVIGWVVGGIYGTVVSVSDYGPNMGLVVVIPVLLLVAGGLVIAIRALILSGIRNFQD